MQFWVYTQIDILTWVSTDKGETNFNFSQQQHPIRGLKLAVDYIKIWGRRNGLQSPFYWPLQEEANWQACDKENKLHRNQ